MTVTNLKLCKLASRIKTNISLFGFAQVDNTWNGTILSPQNSRLYYITKGSATILLKNGREIELSPKNWVLLPSGCTFDFCCEEQMEHVFFHLQICTFNEIDLLKSCKEPIFLNDPDFNYSKIIEYLTCQDTLSSLYIHQFVENTIFKLLDANEIFLEEKKLSPCVASAINYINSNLSAKLTLQEILDSTFTSKSTLTKNFKNELGISVHQYIVDKIMSEIEQLLHQSEMSIGEISDKYNFYDQFYFSKCFKKRYGISPVEYRKTKII